MVLAERTSPRLDKEEPGVSDTEQSLLQSAIAVTRVVGTTILVWLRSTCTWARIGRIRAIA